MTLIIFSLRLSSFELNSIWCALNLSKHSNLSLNYDLGTIVSDRFQVLFRGTIFRHFSDKLSIIFQQRAAPSANN